MPADAKEGEWIMRKSAGFGITFAVGVILLLPMWLVAYGQGTTEVEHIVVSNSFHQISGNETNYFTSPVAIGKEAPESGTKLDISGGNLRLSGGNRIVFSDAETSEENWSIHSDAENLSFEEKESSEEAMRIQDGSGGQFTLFFKGEAATQGKWVVLLPSGNLGVGTTNATEKLHVSGTARFDSGIIYIPEMGDVSMGTFTNSP